MEKLNANRVAVSVGATASALSAICWALLSLFPASMMGAFAGYLTHSLDISGMMTRQPTILNLVISVVAWFIIGAVAGYIFSFVYNLTNKEKTQ